MVKSSNVKEKKGHDDDKPGPNNMEIVCDGSTNVNISQYGLNSIVKNGTIVPIKDSKDIGRLLDHAFTYKERLALKSIDAISENRAHIIVNLCLKMIDKENPNFPAVNSLVQFVRLGGSEKISKSLTGNTGQKYQENIIVNADYANLQRIVYGLYTGQKSIPYEGSKQTQQLRLTINNSSSVAILACQNPNEANFEDSLNTLTHLERCKYFEQGSKAASEKQQTGAAQDPTKQSSIKPQQKGQDSLVQQLQNEINDLKGKTDGLEKDYKMKFQQLGILLMIDDDIEKLLYKKKGQK